MLLNFEGFEVHQYYVEERCKNFDAPIAKKKKKAESEWPIVLLCSRRVLNHFNGDQIDDLTLT